LDRRQYEWRRIQDLPSREEGSGSRGPNRSRGSGLREDVSIGSAKVKRKSGASGVRGKPRRVQRGHSRFGTEGDREGWEKFLETAGEILEEYGDVPFVHWASYERSRLRMYIRRFGDRGGVAGRVERNLLDLLPVTRESVALPLPSYGLKVVEKYVANEYQPPYRSESRNEGNGENSELVADQDVSLSMRRSAESTRCA
jgi:hypothetical protein